MLPKIHRLSDEKDIGATLRSKSRSTPFFNFYWRPNRLPHTRFGFLVSKKVSTKANQRNLVKRRLRAIAARLLPSMPKGVDCLILARTAVVRAGFSELEQQVRNSARQAGLLQD